MSFLLVSDFVFNLVKYGRYVVLGLCFLCIIVLIVAVLFQNQNGNADSITGGYSQDSYYSKHRGTTIEEKLNKITMWASIIIAACVVLYYLSFLIVSTATM